MTRPEIVKLSEADIEQSLKSVPGWTVQEGQLAKSFEFRAYASGVVFAVAAAHIADGIDHHPDILLGYRNVRVAVNTHSVGGLSTLDFDLAKRIDALD